MALPVNSMVFVSDVKQLRPLSSLGRVLLKDNQECPGVGILSFLTSSVWSGSAMARLHPSTGLAAHEHTALDGLRQGSPTLA